MDTFAKIANFVLVLIEVLVIFNLLIIVHELGHFLAARWRGLVVDEFGVWFGKALWKKKINGVWYSLGSIPAGGFVKLPQMAPMEAIEGETETPREQLPSVSPLDKIIVAIAGPLFSLGLAFVFATLVWGVGKPTTEADTTTTIGYIAPDSPAAEAGLKPGDEILSVDGRPVNRFAGMGNSIQWRVVSSEGEKIAFLVRRDGQELTIESGWAKQPAKRLGRSSLREVRIGPMQTPKIGEVQPGTPAEKAGLKPGDVVEAVNGERIFSPMALSDVIEKNPTAPVRLAVNRDGAAVNFEVTPEPLPTGESTRPRIGIAWDPGALMLTHPTPLEQVGGSIDTMFNMIGALASPKSDVKAQHFSGPVGIMRLYYLMFQSEQGWRLALWFSVFFNVNLAILNMLPIPVLDGGHILLAIVEGIRRRPINARVLEVVQTACAVVIIGYILYVSFFDVRDLPIFDSAKKSAVSK